MASEKILVNFLSNFESYNLNIINHYPILELADEIRNSNLRRSVETACETLLFTYP